MDDGDRRSDHDLASVPTRFWTREAEAGGDPLDAQPTRIAGGSLQAGIAPAPSSPVTYGASAPGAGIPWFVIGIAAALAFAAALFVAGGAVVAAHLWL